jgi:hypothetical protein
MFEHPRDLLFPSRLLIIMAESLLSRGDGLMLEYMAGIVIALFFIGLLTFAGVRHQGKAHAAPRAGECVSISVSTPGPLIAALSTKESLKARLEKLSKSPPPKNLKMGAMCYELAGPPDRIDYVCPVCGEKTLYARDDRNRGSLNFFLSYQLQGCREMGKKLKDLNIVLDEHEFCRKCSPATKTPVLILKVTYPGEKTHVVRDVHEDDLELLAEFMNNSDRHVGGQGRETPLKDYVPRLKVLLGIE